MAHLWYLLGITGGDQLYFDAKIWYRLRPNFSKCISCPARLSTKGDSYNVELKHNDKPLP